MRSGDVANLKYENINWEENKISLTQHKTGQPLTLPLLEDIGLAIIDYLKFGRPKCEALNIFVRHSPPVSQFLSNGIYTMVSSYIGKAGLLTKGKKHGPHLRHSKAMHLLQSGVNLVYIRDLLGHADISTTEVYARADEHFKRKALEQAYPSPTPVSEATSWQKDYDLLDWLKNLGK